MDIPKARQRKIALIKAFVEGDVWTWLRENLESQQRRMIALVADPRLSPEQRALVAGQLGLVSSVLAEPEQILKVAERAERSITESLPKPSAPKVHPD